MQPKLHPSLQILLAEDDIDDRHFFDRAVRTLPFDIKLSTVDN
jgi:hypothetical protein